MNIQTGNTIIQNPLHFFDGDLGTLHSLLLGMTDQLLYQLEQSLHALDYADQDLALRVISRDRKVNDHHVRIENQVRSVIDRQTSPANDLRIVTMISKMADSLEKIGNEIVTVARQVKRLYDCNLNISDVELLADTIKIGNQLKTMLNKMMIVLETRDSNQAYKLTRYALNCESELHQGIKRQLILATQKTTLVEQSLAVIHIFRAFERCINHCQYIAEYQILMLDSIDLRRYSKQAFEQVCPDIP